MSWTKEDQAKLREYQTAMMTVKEIAVKMQRPQQLIRAELEAMGYRPIESKPKPESEFLTKGKTIIQRNGGPYKQYTRITPEIEQEALKLRDQGKSIAQVSEILHIGNSSVSRIFKKHNAFKKPSQINQDFEAAVNEMIAEMKEEKAVNAKEKEPAPVAAVTDSPTIEKGVSINNDITPAPKCQSLTGVKMVGVLEDLLHELYDETVEITSLNADTERCEIRFEQKGTAYWINFGAMQELPVYNGGEVRK